MNTDFYIQASAPRMIVDSIGDFESLGEAVERAFPMFAEDALLCWHQKPIRLGYKYDIGECIEAIVFMLDAIQQEHTGQRVVQFPSSGFFCKWHLVWTIDEVEIEAEWDVVHYEDLEKLRKYPKVQLAKDDFLKEWKPLLSRVLAALDIQRFPVPSIEDLHRVFQKLPAGALLYESPVNFAEE